MHVADAGKYYLILEGDLIFIYASDKETLCYEIPVRNRPLPRNGADSCQREFLFPQMRCYMNFLKIILLKSSFIICLFESDVIK